MRPRAILVTRCIVVATLAMLATIACAQSPQRAKPALQLGFEVVRELPHDVAHFTQGLVLDDGRLIESTGGYGRSALYEKRLDDGRVTRELRMSRTHFGEGVALLGARLLQLTWRDGLAFERDAHDWRALRELRYAGEGWGLTQDGREWIMSDGSATLHWRDPRSFAVTSTLQVHDRGVPVARLNELEYARGHVFANVWQSARIAVIDPRSGAVRAWLDLAALERRFDKPRDWSPADHVLNGIAWDAARDRFYVTGKCWPRLFELAIEPLPDSD